MFALRVLSLLAAPKHAEVSAVTFATYDGEPQSMMMEHQLVYRDEELVYGDGDRIEPVYHDRPPWPWKQEMMIKSPETSSSVRHLL